MAVGEIFSRLIDEFGRSIFSNPRLPIGGAVIHRHVTNEGSGTKGEKRIPKTASVVSLLLRYST